MIKLLFSGKQILIVSLIFILVVNTTNLTFPNAVDEKTIMDWGNTVEAAESDDKQVCEDYNGEWKSIGGDDRGCTFENNDDAERYGYRPGFSLSRTYADAEYGIEDLVTYDKEGNKIYPPNPFDETDSSKQQQEEDRAEMTNSKTFEKFVESKGMEYDSYDNLSAEKQEEIESEFREDKAYEYGEEIKEEKIEDHKNTLTTDDEDVKKVIKQLTPTEGEQGYPVESSPVQTPNEPEENEEDIAESEERVEVTDNEETQEVEESVEADEQQVEEEQDEPEEEEQQEEEEEDSSDSESEE